MSVLCANCSKGLSGRAPDVYICAELSDGPTLFVGYCCWGKVKDALKPFYGRSYRGVGPGVTVPWLTPTIVKTGGEK